MVSFGIHDVSMYYSSVAAFYIALRLRGGGGVGGGAHVISIFSGLFGSTHTYPQLAVEFPGSATLLYVVNLGSMPPISLKLRFALSSYSGKSDLEVANSLLLGFPT